MKSKEEAFGKSEKVDYSVLAPYNPDLLENIWQKIQEFLL